MSEQQTPTTEIRLKRTDDYREGYANSVQVKISIWDFQLVFGTMQQTSAEAMDLMNFQGVYLSPQQAKALLNVLQFNVQQYEQTFGKIVIDPADAPAAATGPTLVPGGGPVN